MHTNPISGLVNFLKILKKLRIIPKPSGCEPYRLRSGASYGGGVYANMELRDTKIAFFADRTRKGRRELSYKLVCEQPGTFRILPSFAQAMYCPFVEAISDSGNITITTK